MKGAVFQNHYLSTNLPEMNRKQFLQKSSVAAMGMVLVPSLLSCSAPRVLYEAPKLSSGNLARVRGNVSRYVNQGGNVALFETKEGFVVVDSQFPQLIQPLINGISAKNKPVLYLANTHHHGDHTGGNIAFKDLTENVVAHSVVPSLQRKAAEEKKNLDQQLYPNILFDEVFSFDLGNEKMKGYHLGAGHTFGDVMYHFEKDNVVHMGDLMFINMIPVYRPKDGSNVHGWISVLDKALAKFDDDTLFIFGHADKPENSTGTKENLREMKNFLHATHEFVSQAIAQNKPTDQLLQDHTFVPGFGHRTTPQRFADYITAVRETLEKD